MAKPATATRQKILDAAQRLVMRHGFAATSVDAIQESAGISRGTFFYHFRTKDDLARALLQRHAEYDRRVTDELFARANALARDPLQQVLLFFALEEELFAEAEEGEPGCLFASFSYEAGLFDEETMQLFDESVEYWREQIGGRLREAFRRRPPAVPVDPIALADHAYAVVQGAFVLSRQRGNPGPMIEQLRQLRTYLELLAGVVAPAGEPVAG